MEEIVKVVHVDVDTGQSLMEVQVEPRLFVVFSFLGVPGSQVVCAHRLAKHVILRGLALLPTTVRPQ